MAAIPLFPYPVSSPHPSTRFLCEAWWSCYSDPPHTWRLRSDVLVATGEPFSVVPPSIREPLNLEIKPPGFVPADEPSWRGIPCRFGRVSIWLPSADAPGKLEQFSLLTLLPEKDAGLQQVAANRNHQFRGLTAVVGIV